MPHIVFITTANLATNPRTLKEIKLAAKAGYTVSAIKFLIADWSGSLEEAIECDLKEIAFHNISAERTPFFPWFFSTVISALASYIVCVLPSNSYLNALAINKRTWLINRKIREKNIQGDLVIAHTPGAFFSAYMLSKKAKISFGIDVEDYHPGETNDSAKVKQVEKFMGTLLPKADYVSFASNAIQRLSCKNFKDIKKAFVTDNNFDQGEFLRPDKITAHKKLRLVWFSQNINFTRGLENVLPVLEEFENEIEVMLIGNLKPVFVSFLEPYLSFVKTIPPMLQIDLHHSLIYYDVGLAIEPGKDLNNKIALSNKIWSYFQAGLYIIATDTEAQQEFLNEHHFHGKLFNIADQDSLRNLISTLLENKEEIRANRSARFDRAANFSWDHESKKLLKTWRELLRA